MPSRRDVEAARARLARLTDRAQQALLRLWEAQGGARGPVSMSAVLAEHWSELVGMYGEQAAELGAAELTEWADQQGVTPTVEITGVAGEREAKSRLGWALGEADQLGNLQGVLDQLAKRPHRQTIQASAVASGAAWARVPQGATCAFCTVLASRGAVYSSEASASGPYHPHCDCIAVLVSTAADYPEGYDPEALYAEYDAASRRVGTDMKQVCAEMRRMRNTRDLRDLPSAANRKYWEARRDRLGIHGEWLEPDEVIFVERMHARGEVIEWIPRDQVNYESTNDFKWLSRGSGEVEQKSSTAKYGSIANHIRDAVRDARNNQGTAVKDKFVVDIRFAHLTPKLKKQLGLYNVRTSTSNDPAPIRELWVLSDDGRALDQIPLQ